MIKNTTSHPLALSSLSASHCHLLELEKRERERERERENQEQYSMTHVRVCACVCVCVWSLGSLVSLDSLLRTRLDNRVRLNHFCISLPEPLLTHMYFYTSGHLQCPLKIPHEQRTLAHATTVSYRRHLWEESIFGRNWRPGLCLWERERARKWRTGEAKEPYYLWEESVCGRKLTTSSVYVYASTGDLHTLSYIRAIHIHCHVYTYWCKTSRRQGGHLWVHHINCIRRCWDAYRYVCGTVCI